MFHFRLNLLGFALASVLATAPASAELYKWVDQRGVTHYSDQPPADAASAQRLQPIANRVSVYTPDPALVQAAAALRRQAEQGRVDEVVRRGREPVAAASQDPCLGADAPDCLNRTGSYLPYVPDYEYVPVHRPPLRRITQPRLTPGTIAGNVTGMNGYIPGYSAYAPPRASPAPRVVYEPVPTPRR